MITGGGKRSNPSSSPSQSPRSTKKMATSSSGRAETRSQTQAIISLVHAVEENNNNIPVHQESQNIAAYRPGSVFAQTITGLSTVGSFSAPTNPETNLTMASITTSSGPNPLPGSFTIPSVVSFGNVSSMTKSAPSAASLGHPPAATNVGNQGIASSSSIGLPISTIPTVNNIGYRISSYPAPSAQLGAPVAVSSNMQNFLPATSSVTAAKPFQHQYTFVGANADVPDATNSRNSGFRQVQSQQQTPMSVNSVNRGLHHNAAVSHGPNHQYQAQVIPAPAGVNQIQGIANDMTSSLFVPGSRPVHSGFQSVPVVQNSAYQQVYAPVMPAPVASVPVPQIQVQQQPPPEQQQRHVIQPPAVAVGENLIHYDANNLAVFGHGSNNIVNPYGPLSSSICDPIGADLPASIIAKIVNSEFVDFGLLLDKTSLDREINGGRVLSMTEQGHFMWVEQKSKFSIDKIEDWTDAFLIFSAVYLNAHPSKTQELLKFAHIVRDAAKRFYGWGWRIYDIQFRLRQQRVPNRSWAVLDGELWQFQVGSQPQRAASDNDGGKQGGTHATSTGNKRGGQGKFNKMSSNNRKGPIKDGICFRFNSPKSTCTRKSCQFAHKCSKCGNSSHSAKSCPVKSH